MQEVVANPGAGTVLERITMNDSRWPAADGWVKMSQVVNGVEIHYVRNTITGAVDDFKFK
jgi:filamentous hemagglutinin